MPSWLKDTVFYEIYPQSFYDSNNDGIGDIQGIIQKLDYIQELGCNALWINPCYDSPFKDAGYDIRDFKQVAKRYGSNEDLIELFNRAHKKGIKVLLDLVPGHTSEEHPWFLESKKVEKNEFSDRYIWTDYVFKKPNGYAYIGGESERNGVYLLNFFKSQPALNYGFYDVDDPSWQQRIDEPGPTATREALKEIMRYWLKLGCDGFRVDLAASLVKNDPERKGAKLLWQDIRKMLDNEFPEAALVSEWGVPEQSLNAGFHMDFFLNNKSPGYRSLMRDYNEKEDRTFFKKDTKSDITRFLNDYLIAYESTRELGYYCPITCNHDTFRPRYNLDEEELKIAYAFIFTLPGVPFLYYGDEIGMNYLDIPTKEGGYHRTGSRTPMQWDSSKNAGFSETNSSELYLPVDSSRNAPNVQEQKENPSSLYHVTKKLINLRHKYDDLKADGDFEVIYAQKERLPFVYKRGAFLIAINPSSETQNCKLEQHFTNNFFVYGVGKCSLRNSHIELSPQSFAIYKINQ